MINTELCGQRIRQLREDKGLSQEELGDIENIKVKRQTIAKWESGKATLSLDDAINLCNFLGCDIGYLMGEYDCKRHKTADIRREFHLSEEALQNLMHANMAVGNRKAESDTAITSIDILNGIFSSNIFFSLFSNLSEYVNYTVNMHREFRLSEDGHLLLVPKSHKLLSIENGETYPQNLLEEIYLKNITKDIEKLKEHLLAKRYQSEVRQREINEQLNPKHKPLFIIKERDPE